MDATLFDTHIEPADESRLKTQLARVRQLMSDEHWRSLPDIARKAQGSQTSVSARLRDLRKQGYELNTQNTGNGKWLYQLKERQDD